MRTAAILVVASLFLVTSPGVPPHAEEEYEHRDRADELSKEAYAAALVYWDANVDDLKRLDALFEMALDDPEDTTTFFMSVVDENRDVRAAANEEARSEQLDYDPDDEDLLAWLAYEFDYYRGHWGYLATEGHAVYLAVCRMRVRREHCADAKVYAQEFEKWFEAFARPVDIAADDARRALEIGSRKRIQDALTVCRQQLHVAKMIDSVWTVYFEQFEEFLEAIDEDEFGDYATWWDAWDLDTDDPEFGEHLARWKEMIAKAYDDTHEAELEAKDLMVGVSTTEFTEDQNYRQVDEWFKVGSLTEGMQALIRELEAAL